VLMDVNMPVMDGLQATREIMARTPTPIIIVSALVSNDMHLALSATEAGALLTLAKPPAPNHPQFEKHRAELVRMARAMAEVKVVRHSIAATAAVPERATPVNLSGRNIRLIAIGTSAGGPPALHHILTRLPRDFPVPIVLVQHIAAGFADSFAQWLDRDCALTVELVTKPTEPQAGHVYVAPEDQHVEVKSNGWLGLSDAPAIGGFRPAATHLFGTAGRVLGRSLVAVILTGMGRDGVDGLRIAHQRGALVIAQDEASSVVYGMPREALLAGVVDDVLPLDAIASELRSLAALTHG